MEGCLVLVGALKALHRGLNKRNQTLSVRIAVQHIPCHQPENGNQAGSGEATTILVVLKCPIVVHGGTDGEVVASA